jgi:hypothetical protein
MIALPNILYRPSIVPGRARATGPRGKEAARNLKVGEYFPRQHDDSTPDSNHDRNVAEAVRG